MIMDCVGCEKCRLWGKIQTQGLGTALKVLFSYQDHEKLSLSRQELVSLINTFHRIAESVALIPIFEEMIRKKNKIAAELPRIADDFLASMDPLHYERGGTFYVGLVIVILGAIRIIQLAVVNSRKFAQEARLAEERAKKQS